MATLAKEDKILSALVYAFLSLVLLVVAYPLYFVVIASISDPIMVNTGKVWLYPRGITLLGYQKIFVHEELLRGYRNSLMYMVAGTTLNLVLTLTAAYSLSRRDLVGRNGFMAFLTFTMFFHGGLIPTFLLVRSLGLYNTFWVMILPNAVGVWNVIIARTFFQSNVPQELLDAAVIDGCSDFKFFLRVVLPLSAAIIAVMMVFYAVGHWNAYFNGLIYLKSKERFPLQLILREILIQNQFNEEMAQEMVADGESVIQAQMIAEAIKYGIIIVASLPMLILYPFVQRHYVKGVMIGAIKG